MSDPLVQYFMASGLDEYDAGQAGAAFMERSLKKGDHFVEEGKTSRFIGFVEEGLLQYYINVDGEERTTYTVGTNGFVASLISFLQQSPAKENIRAVTSTRLRVIDKPALRSLLATLPAFKECYIGLLEWQICCIDETRLDSIMLTAQQRYEKMLQKEPQLVRDIPLQFLASMLGITPRHLSRIRNNIRHD